MTPVVLLAAALTCIPCQPRPTYRQPVVSPMGLITLEKAELDTVREGREALAACQKRRGNLLFICPGEYPEMSTYIPVPKSQWLPPASASQCLKVENGKYVWSDCSQAAQVVQPPPNVKLVAPPETKCIKSIGGVVDLTWVDCKP